eukprot:SAG11_NODE_20350_length_447_cov_1.043103_2_plen_82_part_01
MCAMDGGGGRGMTSRSIDASSIARKPSAPKCAMGNSASCARGHATRHDGCLSAMNGGGRTDDVTHGEVAHDIGVSPTAAPEI